MIPVPQVLLAKWLAMSQSALVRMGTLVTQELAVNVRYNTQNTFLFMIDAWYYSEFCYHTLAHLTPLSFCFQHPLNLNAGLILIAPKPRPVLERNVWTHAIQLLVVLMLSAGWITTELSVSASLVMKEIHMKFVKNVSQINVNVACQRLIYTKNHIDVSFSWM